MAKGTREEVKSLNHYLEEVKAKLMNCYQEMQIHKQLITAKAIKNKFLGTDEKGHTLCKVVLQKETDVVRGNRLRRSLLHEAKNPELLLP